MYTVQQLIIAMQIYWDLSQTPLTGGRDIAPVYLLNQ